MEIFDLNLEQNLLSGILRHPNTFPDVDGYIVSTDFRNKLHKTIWEVIRHTLLAGEPIDNVIIAQKIDRLSLSFEDKLSSVADYLEELTLNQVKEESVKHTAQELKAVSIRRNIAETANEIAETMYQHAELNADQAVAVSDKIYTKVVNNFKSKNEPLDLFKGAESYIQTLMDDTPSDEIISPYQRYQELFGGYFPGDLVLFASAPKSGKSTLLMDLIRRACENQEDNVKALIIDTELETYRVQRRMISSISGVNEYLIKSKKWRQNTEYVDRVQEALKKIRAYFDKVDHIYVGNTSTEEMASIVRRWHWKKVNKHDTKKEQKDKPLVAIDYFKLTGADNVTDAFASSMSLGYRVDTFKKLASELQCPILGACQTNRMNEVGLSHEINKFVSSLFFFNRKTEEEMARDNFDPLNPKNATHKLVPLYTRDLGEHVDGVNNLVPILGDRGKTSYVPNYLNFKLDNFTVTEMGDLRSLMKQRELRTMNIARQKFDGDLSFDKNQQIFTTAK